jgi:hypothetical protein
MKPNSLQIDPHDNVVTVLQDVPAGGAVHWTGGEPVEARAAITAGHKVAIEPIPAGAVIRKYGYAIGTAGEAIAPGDWVHTHNLEAVGE